MAVQMQIAVKGQGPAFGKQSAPAFGSPSRLGGSPGPAFGKPSSPAPACPNADEPPNDGCPNADCCEGAGAGAGVGATATCGILESSTPLPGVLLLNNDGILSSWWFVYADSIRHKFGASPMTDVSSPESFNGTLARLVSSLTSVVMNWPT
jgi:hypothetical protein